jgi:ligand-binding SRPBCC domain-containing protein
MERRMAGRLETEQWVPYPVELVFAFFANPTNLPHLMPAKLGARIEDLRLQPPPARPVADDPARRFQSVAAGTGSEILVSFRPVPWLPPRVSWTARIIDFVWNSHFIDEQVRGPFSSFRHRHGIQSETRIGVEGTLVADAIEYALTGGVFGRLAAGFVQKQLQQSFDHRHQRLPEILSAAAKQAVKRG